MMVLVLLSTLTLCPASTELGIPRKFMSMYESVMLSCGNVSVDGKSPVQCLFPVVLSHFAWLICHVL